jgi:DNA mismatch repair protein MutL
VRFLSKITVLDESTINQIAAGEVIERPAAVVKELVENSIDAGASAVTVEIKEGGISLIRITDNGAGIEEDDMPYVFLRHSTSKIKKAEDLLKVSSLGFRGEALSSIAAIAQVELVTKTSEAFTGMRYLIDGGKEKSLDHIGCPNGTTFIIRNLFYNTPARRKFLKSATTEAGYISDLMERLALSHPDVSFKFIVNGQIKLHTSGNHNQKDVIYHIYGRDITGNLLSLYGEGNQIKIEGFIAKPIVSRGNRNYENYFINGRYVKSGLINKAIEEAYRPYIMLHRYPFTSLLINIDSDLIDVNVHPAKLEIRFKNGEELYQLIYQTIKSTLEGKELIPEVKLTEDKVEHKKEEQKVPEPFETKRRQENYQNKWTTRYESSHNDSNRYLVANNEEIKETEIGQLNRIIEDAPNLLKNGAAKELKSRISDPSYTGISETINNGLGIQGNENIENSKDPLDEQAYKISDEINNSLKETDELQHEQSQYNDDSLENNNGNNQGSNLEINQKNNIRNNQENTLDNNIGDNLKNNLENNLVKEDSSYFAREVMYAYGQAEQLSFISEEAIKEHKIIGQIFKTYWIVEYGDKMFLIDQHAAHEKVLYEKIMISLKGKEFFSQQLLPPIILSLSLREEEALHKHMDYLHKLGFEFEEFGGKEYAVRAVPGNLYGLVQYEILIELIDSLVEEVYNDTPEIVLEKIASMSCKAAVKGNQRLSYDEARALIEQLLTLENPYNCPHGRPVIVSMSKYELEKKFKRIL